VRILKILLYVQLLYVVNQVHFHWQPPIPGVAVTNLLFLAVLLAMWGKPDEVTERPMLQKPLLFFFGTITFAFLWGLVRGTSDFLDDITYFKNALFFPLFYFIYVRCKQDEKSTRDLIIWILVIAAVAGLEATRQGIGFGFGKYNPFHRASGPFGEDWHNANRAGVFYAMFIPMFMALGLFLRGQKLWRLAAVGGIALIAGGILFTYSRQSYFLALLAVTLLLLRKSIVLTVVMGALIVSLAGLLPDAVFQRVEETKQVNKKGQEEVDESTAARWQIWGEGMVMLSDHPLGVGLHHFKDEIGFYGTHKHIDAHNFYVLTLAEEGPQGLIALLFVFFSCFKVAAFVRKNTAPDDHEGRALALGFTISTVCMCMGGIYGSPHFEGAVMAPYWAMCGLLERYTHLKMQRAGQKPADAPRQATLVDRFPLAVHIRPGAVD
jgi:O-antigen ligase